MRRTHTDMSGTGTSSVRAESSSYENRDIMHIIHAVVTNYEADIYHASQQFSAFSDLVVRWCLFFVNSYVFS